MRVAVYARYSDDRQNERSIADQVELAHRYVLPHGWTVALEFSDAAISGWSKGNRPGLMAALAAIERGDCDIFLAEHEDRFARNLEDLAHIFNRIDDAGGQLWTIATGRVELMHVAMKGWSGQEFLTNLSAKTKRGMHSNAEKGLATGSRLYGYKSAEGGALAIVPAERDVVIEIFTRFSEGQTVRAIVADLNARGVPGPRGGHWSPSTLAGNDLRGSGMFNCELYVGMKVWNRVEMKKDRQSGSRISRARPPAEWKRTPVPHLRILDDETWAAARARRARVAALPAIHRNRPRSAFSGLLRCADCGASMTAFNSRGRLVCIAHREKGPAVCANGRTVPRDEVERRVLQGLRTRLLSPVAVRAYVRAYHAAWAAKQAAASSSIAPLARRLQEASRTIERLVDKICDGSDTPATNARLKELEADKVRLAAELEQAQRAAPAPLTLHPGAANAFAERIGRLQDVLHDTAALAQPNWAAIVSEMRDLVVRVDVRYDPTAEAGVAIELHGQLASFLEPRAADPATMRLYKVVAGARSGLTQIPDFALKIAC